MSGTVTLLQLAGYVGLLLWGTHMVSTGVERGFGVSCVSGSAALCRAPEDARASMPFCPGSP